MIAEFSRRSLMRGATIGAAALGTSPLLGGTASAMADVAPPLPFGPAPGVALLSRNENPYGPAPSAIQAMASTASKGCYYSDQAGAVLTAMIAERFGLDPDHIALSGGSTEALCSIALAWTPKGAILCPDLFWDTTAKYAEAKGAILERVPLGVDMAVDLDAMEAAIGPGTGLVQICNPNNPTGMVLDGDKLRAFIRRVSPNVTVLVDEAYMELTDNPEYSSVVDLVKEGQNLIVTRTFSKIYGMAGLRVGYAIASPDKVAVIRNYMMGFGGNQAGLAAAIASYNDTSFTSFSKGRITEARAIMLDAVKRAGVEALPSQTNFLFVKVPDADKVREAMAAQNIMIRGAYGKWTQWSRVSTGRIEDVKRYAAALPAALGV